MELFSLSALSAKYRKPVEIETALVWNALKTYFEKEHAEILYKSISDVMITPKNITLFMTSSVARQECVLRREAIDAAIFASLSRHYPTPKRNLKIV